MVQENPTSWMPSGKPCARNQHKKTAECREVHAGRKQIAILRDFVRAPRGTKIKLSLQQYGTVALPTLWAEIQPDPALGSKLVLISALSGRGVDVFSPT